MAAYTTLGLLSLTWGCSFPFISISVETIPPLFGSAVRSTLAAAILIALSLAMGLKFPRFGRGLRPFLALGFFSCSIPFFLLSYAQQHIDSGLAAILVATTPLFTTIFRAIRLRRRPAASEITGILIGLIGVVVLMGPDALAGLGQDIVAQAAALATAAAYALGIVIASAMPRYPPSVMASCTLSSATIMLWPVALIVDSPSQIEPALDGILALAGLIIIGSVVASILYYRVIEMAGATFASFSTYLNPLVAVVLGALILSEAITLAMLAAVALILGGVAIAGRVWRRA